jgi:hypothetical protein
LIEAVNAEMLDRRRIADQLRRCLSQEIRATEVHADHLVEAFFRRLQDVRALRRGDSGIIHQQVEATKSRRHKVDHSHPVAPHGDVRLDDFGTRSASFQTEPPRFFSGRLVSCEIDRDLVSLLAGERERNPAANPSRGSSDQDDRVHGRPV